VLVVLVVHMYLRQAQALRKGVTRCLAVSPLLVVVKVERSGRVHQGFPHLTVALVALAVVVLTVALVALALLIKVLLEVQVLDQGLSPPLVEGVLEL
jgi:hypothetical protein